MKMTRRGLLGAASAAWATTILGKPASAAAEFDFKLGVNTPDTHPLTLRLIEAAREIGTQSSGRLNVTVFPNSQLGGDPEMLSQVRAGGIELLAAPSLTLSILVPLSGLPSIGFAFQSYDQVWAAMDGGVGDVVRDAIGKAGIVPMKKVWDNGFRQITSSSSRQTQQRRGSQGLQDPRSRHGAADLAVLRARRAAVQHQLQRALFGPADPYRRRAGKSAGAGLDRQDVRGAEILRAVEPLLERLLDRRQPPRAGRLPADLLEIVNGSFDAAAVKERADLRRDGPLAAGRTHRQSMIFNKPDPVQFRAALVKAGFYAQWQKTYGAEAWAQLEQYTGPLT